MIAPGCANNDTTTLTCDQMAAELITALQIPYVQKVSGDEVRTYYDFEAEEGQDLAVYISTSGNAADEVAIFSYTDSRSKSAVIDAIDERMSRKKIEFKELSPAEYEKLQKSAVVERGHYIFFVVCSQSNKASREIKKIMRK